MFFSKQERSIPIGTDTVSPAYSFPGNNSHPNFTHSIETVISARNAIPKTLPLSAHMPDGMSIAAFSHFLSFIHSITVWYLPSIALLNPTPNTASIITVYSFLGKSVNTEMPSRSAICFCVRHSSLIDASCPTNNTSAQKPYSFNIRAAANPSPPLFPLPHTTSVSEKSTPLSFKTLTVSSAALSINTSDGIPTFSIVYVSAAFICAPLGRYLIDLTAFIMLFKWERPQFPAGFCLQVSIFSVRLLAD